MTKHPRSCKHVTEFVFILQEPDYGNERLFYNYASCNVHISSTYEKLNFYECFDQSYKQHVIWPRIYSQLGQTVPGPKKTKFKSNGYTGLGANELKAKQQPLGHHEVTQTE